MSNQPAQVRTTFYAIVTPQWRDWLKDDQGRPILDGCQVERITKNRPKGRTEMGAVVTRLTLVIDAVAFIPLQPQAEIVIEVGETGIIMAKAHDPGLTESEES